MDAHRDDARTPQHGAVAAPPSSARMIPRGAGPGVPRSNGTRHADSEILRPAAATHRGAASSGEGGLGGAPRHLWAPGARSQRIARCSSARAGVPAETAALVTF
jgi:hypothetical protein